jgi:hypothetical protein
VPDRHHTFWRCACCRGAVRVRLAVPYFRACCTRSWTRFSAHCLPACPVSGPVRQAVRLQHGRGPRPPGCMQGRFANRPYYRTSHRHWGRQPALRVGFQEPRQVRTYRSKHQEAGRKKTLLAACFLPTAQGRPVPVYHIVQAQPIELSRG